jgi:UDP-N-acetylmuramoylalanine--D-glutamate ligase
MKHPEQYKGLEVVVLGLAKSGQAVAKTLHGFGAVVTVNDQKERHASPEADELEQLGIKVICGGHPADLMHSGVQLVVKNPGIPYTAQPIQQALALGIEIVTEVEVASFLTEAPIIGITGSNGKTTTTTWVGQMLEAGQLHPIVAGNIGRPLCDAATDATKTNQLVVELSSFQLKGTTHFKPHVACLLNVAETHLDYHGDMEDYVQSKYKLFANQTSEDFAVLNADDPACLALVNQVQAAVLLFSISKQLENGFCLATDANHVEWLVRTEQNEIADWICKVQDVGILGRYNVENALAATAMAYASGVSITVIADVIQAFRGVEHRLEFVAEKQGVRYFNNSKATNAQASIKALQAFPNQVIWIGGGLDRGSDYMELLPYLKEKVKAAVLVGETKEKIKKVAQLAGVQEIALIQGGKETAGEVIQEAVKKAATLAQPGDVVLLSPACASWDMFPSYEVRGRIFKEAVHNI